MGTQPLMTYVAQNKERQAHILEKIGVDEYICRIGNALHGARDFFVLSARTWSSYYVHDGQAPQNDTATDLTSFRRNGKSIEFIVLN